MGRFLQATSLLYCLPLYAAWAFCHDALFRYGTLYVVVLSQCNHASYHPVVRVADMAGAHFMIAYLVYDSLGCLAVTWRVMAAYASIAYSFLSFWVFQMSRDSDGFHALIHAATSAGSFLYFTEEGCNPSAFHEN
eukprot:jgi/Mesvir1/18331/Mv18484-RA.1